MPTEAESEYACRSGTIGRNYLGTDAEGLTKIGNVADAAAKAVFPHWNDFVKSSDGYVYTSPVGRFRPNVFGLYDTIGNAGEWSSDRYAADYYEHSPVDDPTGPEKGEARVGRGGGFTHAGGSCFRLWGPNSFARPDLGFRVVCEIGPRASQNGLDLKSPETTHEKGDNDAVKGSPPSARIRNRMSRSRRLLPRRLPRLQQFRLPPKDWQRLRRRRQAPILSYSLSRLVQLWRGTPNTRGLGT